MSKPDKDEKTVILDLKQVFELIGEVLPVSYEMDLSDYELYETRPFASPVEIRGSVRNEAGMVILSYEAAFSLRMPCDRCLEEFERAYRFSFEEVLVLTESSSEEDYVVVPGGQLDMDALCLSDLLLSLPYKMLCREDCQGLCPQCGANLNQGSCSCTVKEADPRLAVLGELLK